MRCLSNRRGQGLLEGAITIVLMVLFLGGIVNIWLWANKQMVMRQRRYNATRVIAGTAVDGYQLRWAPDNPVYVPEELTEDMVLLNAPLLASEPERERQEPQETSGNEEVSSPIGPSGRYGPFADPLPTDDMPEETPEDVVSDLPGGLPEGLPEGTLEDGLKGVPKIKDTLKDVPDDAPEDVVKDALKDTPEYAPEDVVRDALEGRVEVN